MMKRLSIILACSIVLISAVLVIGVWSTRDRVVAEADRVLISRAHSTADAIDQTLQQRMVEVFTFAALPSLRALAASDEIDRQIRLPVARAELQSIVAADPNVRSAAVMDQTGKVILATDKTMNENWGDRVFVQQAFRGQLYVSVPVREFGEISQYYTAPLLNNSRDVAGALVIRIAVQEMWGAFGNQPEMLLVDENGVRIADTSAKPQTFVALEPLQADVAATIYQAKFYGTETTQIRSVNLPELAAAVRRQVPQVIYHDAQGQTWHAAAAPLKTNSWTVIASANEDSILAPVRDNFWIQFMTALVSAIVGASAVFIWLTKLTPSEKAG